jgi:uncharacterized protein (TIGR04222 family)
MTSAEFLISYGVGCAAILLFAWWFVARADDSADSGREPLPTAFDPQEIAFLRGDTNELVRFTVFDLMRSGYLEMSRAEGKRERTIRRTMTVPDRSLLDPVGALVYDYFVEPQTARALFASPVPKVVAEQSGPRREPLLAKRLLNAPRVRRASQLARVVGAAAILAVGASRIVYALSLNHRNVAFTVVMAVVAIVLLLAVTRVPRLSKRGRMYVASLRAALPPSGSLGAASPSLSPTFAVVVAASGMAVLAGTPYAALGQSFGRQAASASGSCSGGCGSGSSSSGCSGGGSCGGGCGGGGD